MEIAIKGTCRRADVLLTYAWVRSSYAALRNLTKHGVSVAVADTYRVGMCQFSRHARVVLRYRSPFSDPEGFVTDIANHADHYGVRMVLPSHNETEILAKHRNRLPPGVTLPVAEHESIVLANDKQRCQAVAREAGLSVPAELAWRDPNELPERVRALGKPVVVKLRRSNSAKGVFYPASAEAVGQTVRRLISEYQLPAGRYPIVQERIAGVGCGVSCLYWHGQFVASFTHRRLREKTDTGGTSTLRESYLDEPMTREARALLDRLKWHGLAMVEFKQDLRAGVTWFIEVNPRLWGSLHLAVSAGVEFPYLLYLCATAGPAAARDHAARLVVRHPWRARWYLGDCIKAVQLLARGRLWSAIRLTLPGGADTYDDFTRDDPRAFVGELLHYGSRFLSSRSTNPVEGPLG